MLSLAQSFRDELASLLKRQPFAMLTLEDHMDIVESYETLIETGIVVKYRLAPVCVFHGGQIWVLHLLGPEHRVDIRHDIAPTPTYYYTKAERFRAHLTIGTLEDILATPW